MQMNNTQMNNTSEIKAQVSAMNIRIQNLCQNMSKDLSELIRQVNNANKNKEIPHDRVERIMRMIYLCNTTLKDLSSQSQSLAKAFDSAFYELKRVDDALSNKMYTYPVNGRNGYSRPWLYPENRQLLDKMSADNYLDTFKGFDLFDKIKSEIMKYWTINPSATLFTIGYAVGTTVINVSSSVEYNFTEDSVTSTSLDITKIQSDQIDCIKNLSISSGVGGIGLSGEGISFSMNVPETGAMNQDNTTASITVSPVLNGKKASLNIKTNLENGVDVSTEVEITRLNDNYNYRSYVPQTAESYSTEKAPTYLDKTIPKSERIAQALSDYVGGSAEAWKEGLQYCQEIAPSVGKACLCVAVSPYALAAAAESAAPAVAESAAPFVEFLKGLLQASNGAYAF